MPWFFTENEINSKTYALDGETARHISKSLRMKSGEELTLVSPSGIQHDCVIDGINADIVSVLVKSSKPCENEPECRVTLYQALPKGDKMELIIQKCVELGVTKIVPVISARCISRPDEKSLAKKRVRWQKIAREAAQQSRRGIVPEIAEAVSFKQAVKLSGENERTVIFYELGGDSVKDILSDTPRSVGIFIGSEGGFEEQEVELVLAEGGRKATLGKRILRAETAPLAALSIIMYQTGEFDNKSTVTEEFENDRNNMRS